MKRLIIYIASALVLFSACQDHNALGDMYSTGVENTTLRTTENEAYDRMGTPGVVYVKMDPAAAKRLKDAGEISPSTFSSLNSDIEVASRRLGVKSVERLFPHSEEYAERHKAFGLDRWYVVRYETSNIVSYAIQSLSAVNDFEVVEPCYDIQIDGKQVGASFTGVPFPMVGVTDAATFKFNDPRFAEQWHYHNLGTASWATQGADINLLKAWEVETGKPNVIIAVIDDGVDVTHEDLKENLWINPNVTGPTDRTTYIEDVNGGNFVKNGVRGNHGTHVAGTVGARNNNGKGVCGVAGGDGTKDSGVRIMECLAIDSRPKDLRQGSRPEAALVFAADNGAVIAQNSWGLPPNAPLTQSLKVAIDYFIANAGVDKSGNQRQDSPMKGGVVIVAAGNDNEDALCYPAAYEPAIAVAAMAPNFTRSSFTNRGAWVDIMAPGGDQTRFGDKAGVLSCVPGNRYAFYQGTSMACPHVSGIAGLILSKKGKQGYTNEDLKKAILSALRPEDIDQKNAREVGRLGRGYIDASLAFDDDNHIAPDMPTLGSDINVQYTSISLSWKVNKDDDDKLPLFQELYYSNAPITAEVLKNMEPIRMRSTVVAPGQEMYRTIEGLKHSTKYYFALISEDRWGNKSNPLFFEYSTRINREPVIAIAPHKNIVVSGNKSEQIKFTVTDPDGHFVKCRIEGETTGVSLSENKGQGVIQIRSVLPEGEHKFTLIALDEFQGETRHEIKFYVVRPKPLMLKGDFSQVVLGMDVKELTVAVKENIDYNPQLSLKVEARSNNESVVLTSVSKDGELKIIPVSNGRATIYLKIQDETAEKLEISFKVQVVSDSKAPVHIVYPIPVTKTLNIMLNKSIKDAKIKVVTLMGKVLIDVPVKQIGRNSVVSLNVANLTPNTYRLIVESSNMPSHEQIFVK
ncbi:S8 family serine peptidase [Porphyromonas sp.]|uniref:S8 family serine peptidase n=1 Tax=Porphyromonas sp. TaxID=1924944 RepID=UPI0026DAF939|nr:S8 family serine peptidase [Porphyromonas sp.]MDO4770945.1 S8 family serine peptidase [Porphyromonas sp.]